MEWKDGSVDWVPPKYIKQSNSVELAEYAVANDISDEPAFNWCVKETFRQIYSITSELKYKYCQTSHKFGIRVSKKVKESYEIDSK